MKKLASENTSLISAITCYSTDAGVESYFLQDQKGPMQRTKKKKNKTKIMPAENLTIQSIKIKVGIRTI